MQCPACTNHLVTLELSGVEVDHCFACQGVWLDRGELERLVSPADDHIIAGIRPAVVREEKKRCPVCRRSMEKVTTGGEDGVVLDRCMRHGLWSDTGELRKILAMNCGEGHASPLVRILDDMFAEHKRGCV